jgi:hypothetical protein
MLCLRSRGSDHERVIVGRLEGPVECSALGWVFVSQRLPNAAKIYKNERPKRVRSEAYGCLTGTGGELGGIVWRCRLRQRVSDSRANIVAAAD